MLYSALCLDTSTFFEKGTIKVRVFEYYTPPRLKYDVKEKKIIVTNVDDLSVLPKELTTGDQASVDIESTTEEHVADFEALVHSPLGGGRNYGMLVLPKTNEKGIVAFLDGMLSKPIWIGSYFQPVRQPDDYNNIGYVNAPNEDPAQESESKDFDNGKDFAKDGVVNFSDDFPENLKGDQNTIILRTKTTTPSDDKDEMDFEVVKTENLIAIDSKKIRVRHFSGYDEDKEKYQEVLIYKDSDNDDKDTIELEVNNTTDSKQSYVKITEDGFNFYMNNDGDETIFKLGVSEESDSLYFKDKDDNTIIGDGSALFINGDEDSVVLYSDLKDILEQLMEHIHIGSVPTKGPLTNKKAPLQYKKQMTDMEASLIKSKNKR